MGFFTANFHYRCGGRISGESWKEHNNVKGDTHLTHCDATRIRKEYGLRCLSGHQTARKISRDVMETLGSLRIRVMYT